MLNIRDEKLAHYAKIALTGFGKIDLRHYNRDEKRWIELHPKNSLTWDELPPRALFLLILPMLRDHTGFMINRDRRWLWLNIYPSGNYSESPRDSTQRERVLFLLHQEGFINFQSSGSIWRIEICPTSLQTSLF